MKALVCRQFGPLDDLQLEECPVPQPGPGQVCIQTGAVSLNFPDVLISRGDYQVRPALPFSPGAELAGVIRAVGAGVSGWRVGDRVLASTGYGALAESCVVDAWRLVPLPDEVGFDLACTLVVTYGTVLHALQRCVVSQPGQTLLVCGAAGGIGTAAVQVGHALGLKVIAAVSSEDKAMYCRDLGADAVVSYAQPEALKERVMALTQGQGADLVLDPVGGVYGLQALRCLGWRGCYLVVGFAAGEISRFPLNLALLQERRIQGVYWGEAIRKDPQAYREIVGQLLAWVAQGRLAPVVSERIRLEDTVQGLQRLARREVRGKVVVTFKDMGLPAR